MQIQYRWSGFDDRAKQLDPFILKQISKSMTHLVENTTTRTGLPGSRSAHLEIEIVMATCVILVFMLLMTGDLSTARIHLTHGIAVMREYDLNNSLVGPALSQSFDLLLWKLQMYSDRVSYTREDSPLLLYAPQLETFDMSTTPYNIDRYWSMWSGIILQTRPDYFCIGTVGDSDSSSWSLSNSELCVLFKARVWERQLKNYLGRADGKSAPQSLHDISTLLELWREVVCTKLGTSMGVTNISRPSKLRYDGFWVHFQRANELASELLESLTRRGLPKPAFPIDPAVVTPLFFSGFYCSNWDIRRETLRLLRAWIERFDLNPFTRTKLQALERIIEIESEGLQPGEVVPESARVDFARVAMYPKRFGSFHTVAGSDHTVTPFEDHAHDTYPVRSGW